MADPETQKKLLIEIAKSDDQTVNEILISIGQGNIPGNLGRVAEELIIKRIQENGLPIYAELVEAWMIDNERRGIDFISLPVFKFMVGAADVTAPLEQRKADLRNVYETDKLFASKLTSALYVEGNLRDAFGSLLKEFLLDLRGAPGNDPRPGLSLLVSDKELWVITSARVMGTLHEYSVNDLLWALSELSRGDDPRLFDVASNIVERKELSPLRAVFLETLLEAERGTMPYLVKVSLVNGARGEVSRDDVVVLSNWISIDVERPFLAIVATSEDPEIQLSAFDSLTVRSTISEPTRSLINWVQRKHWAERAKLIHSIAVLGLSDVALDPEVEGALDNLMPYSADGQLLRFVMDSAQDRLLSKLLARVSEITDTPTLLKLLKHRNKDVRIQALRGLAGRNDLMVLQSITRAYREEKDPDVRAVYQSPDFWFVQGR